MLSLLCVPSLEGSFEGETTSLQTPEVAFSANRPPLLAGHLLGNNWISQACPEPVEGFPSYPFEHMPWSKIPVVT